MKIDRKNPLHWCYLAACGLWVGLVILLRPLWRNAVRNRRVLLYGHKLGGNLLALQRYLRASRPDIDVKFLTLDPRYRRELAGYGESVVLATSPMCIPWLATAEALVTDHGLHSLRPLLHLSDIKFFDVWHGIPFKGFDADDFQVQHRYDGVCVASEMMRKLYVERFGFRPEIVHATGYARTDCLIDKRMNVDLIKRHIELSHESCGKLILFAPTWKQDSNDRSLFPFGLGPDVFLNGLAASARAFGATVLLRSHLNSGRVPFPAQEGVVHIPYERYPDTEALLLVSDVLICDWSSIAFDFLLLDRPALFLDVEPPFRKGFSLGPEYRYGAVVRNLSELTRTVEVCLNDPDAYWRVYGDRHVMVKDRVYGDQADGLAAKRCAETLLGN